MPEDKPDGIPDAVWASVRSVTHYPVPNPRTSPEELPDDDGWLATTGPYEIRLEDS